MKPLIFFFFSSCLIGFAGNPVQTESKSISYIPNRTINIDVEDSLNIEWKPDLYWGEHRSGSSTDRNLSTFYVKYATDIPVNELFTIQSLELSFNGRVAHISGNRLTNDIHGMIRELPFGTTVYAFAHYKDEKGIIRIIEGQWQLK